MVFDELIGIHIPRHVTSLMAQLPLLGAAFEMALPLLAILAVGKAIADLTEKMSKHGEEAEKTKILKAQLSVDTKDISSVVCPE